MKLLRVRKGFIEPIGVPYLINGDEFVAYDDEKSIRIKVLLN